jgi:hypothetical protein
MSASHQLSLRSAGAHSMGCQQRCMVGKPVAVFVWQQKTEPGLQN